MKRLIKLEPSAARTIRVIRMSLEKVSDKKEWLSQVALRWMKAKDVKN